MRTSRLPSSAALLFAAAPLLADQDAPNVRLSEWERGFAVESRDRPGMAVYLWFYEWNLFDALHPGQHTKGSWQWTRQLDDDGRRGVISADALTLEVLAAADGAELKLIVHNQSGHDFPPLAAIIPCFNPGPERARNPQFANTNTYFLGPRGLEKLSGREIHFQSDLRALVDREARDGRYVWSEKWPLAEPNAVGGLIVRESTDGRWVCGIAWEDFLSAQAHNPWECMHLSVRVGPLKRGESKTVRGRIYLFEGDRDELLRRYRRDFGPETTAGDLRERAERVLAQLDGEIAVPGLARPVEVLRDRWGVPHIFAQNPRDLFFAQGFIAAQDRLFQIDLWRRIAVGETAEVLGAGGLARDRFARLVRYRGDMAAEWASYGADAQDIVTAFTHGINAYIDHIGDRLPIEFEVLGYRPGKWRPEDCLGRMSVLPVALNLQRELLRAELVATVGLDQARRLMPTDPPIDVTPAAGLDLSGVGQVLAAYKAVTDPIVFRADSFSDGATERAAAAGGDLEGSNNWVIDGTLSASGKPMLANDPHRLITLPSLRYLVHLHAPGWNVIGSGEPALPGVAVGHNERIAWGFTVVTTDQADLFVEETHPDDPLRYRVGDRWEAMTVLRESTLVRREGGVDAEPLELCFTRHGPVIHADRERNRAYALRWVGSEPGTAAYLASLSLDRAGNWREFLDAAGRWKTPSENVIYADVDGDIGWVAAALTPVRKGWQGLLPVPGASDTYDWQGFRNVEELPQMHNPRQHFVVTANHNILPPGYRHEVSYEWAAPFRARRLRQLLGAQTRFTLEDFERMQFDHLSLPAAELAALPAKVGVNDPSLAPFAELLRAWDGRLAKDSAAAALYVLWQRELVQAFFSGRCPSHLMEELTRSAAATVMLPELMRPTEAWFGADASAKRDQLVREALARAVATARQRQGDDPADWELGRVQQELFKHPLAGLGPSYARAFNIGPYSGGSGPDAPDQARHDKLDFSRTHGATYRQVFDLADWDKGLATSAPGQSGQPGSPHYDDLAPLWNAGEYFPLAFSREKVEEVTRHRLVLSPGP